LCKASFIEVTKTALKRSATFGIPIARSRQAGKENSELRRKEQRLLQRHLDRTGGDYLGDSGFSGPVGRFGDDADTFWNRACSIVEAEL